MAGTGLLALLDDITAILDDVAAMSKVAAKKTAGIAGDDLAVNAEGLVGLDPSRELPIVGKVALGSLVNKMILVPVALVLPAPAITPLLMVGGTFLCYEGVHKVAHKHGPADEEHHEELVDALKTGPGAVAEVERKKVKQAIFTDFVLSAEIIAVALGTVATEPLATKAGVLSVVGVGMTVLVYGLVAGIVKVDDVGLHLQKTGAPGSPRERLGRGLVAGMPYFMKTLSFVGTVAMFLVGGGIILHGLHAVEHEIHHFIESLTQIGFVISALETLATLGVGILVGLIAVAVVEGVKKALVAAGLRASSQH